MTKNQIKKTITASLGKIVLLTAISLLIGISSFYYFRYSPSTLLIEMKTSPAGYGQVFWNTGKGYNGLESYRFPLEGTDQLYTYEIPLPASKLKAVRLDPMESPGSFAIKSFRIKGRNSEHIWNYEKLRTELVLLQNVKGEIDNSVFFAGNATTDDPSVEINNIPGDLLEKTVSERIKLSILYMIGSFLILLSLSTVAFIKAIDKLQHVSERTWMLILGLGVFLTNIQIYWVKVFAQDDNNWLFIWQSVSPLNKKQAITFGTIIDRLMTWIAVAGNLYLARTLVLIVILIPLSLLLFRILRKLGYPLPVALFSAGLIGFFPGQTEIPIFINGSYVAEAMLIMAIAFWGGLKFLDSTDKYQWRWYTLSVLTFFWALNISELVVPTAAALIFCFLFWRHFEKKAWLLSVSIAILTAYHTYFHIIKNGRDVVQRSLKPFTLESFIKTFQEFMAWCSPSIYVLKEYSHQWTILIISIASLSLLIGLARSFILDAESKTVSNKRFFNTTEYGWRVILPLIWCLSSLCVLSVAYLRPRLALFPAFGLYLFLSFVMFEAFKKLKYVKTATVVLLIVLSLGSAMHHYKNVGEYYKPMNQAHNRLIEFGKQRHYPANAQIVIADMDTSTGGFWWWSTGYLRYAFSRADVSGLVGNEFMFSNIFKPATYTNGGMNGLNLEKPLFLYRLSRDKFKQLTYCLKWEDNDVNSNFTIYRIDAASGKATPLTEGKGLNAFLSEANSLAKQGVNRADIMWGGEPSKLDMQRLGL